MTDHFITHFRQLLPVLELTDEEAIKKMQRILDLLDEDDDVQAVYHNWDE